MAEYEGVYNIVLRFLDELEDITCTFDNENRVREMKFKYKDIRDLRIFYTNIGDDEFYVKLVNTFKNYSSLMFKLNLHRFFELKEFIRYL